MEDLSCVATGGKCPVYVIFGLIRNIVVSPVIQSPVLFKLVLPRPQTGGPLLPLRYVGCAGR